MSRVRGLLGEALWVGLGGEKGVEGVGELSGFGVLRLRCASLRMTGLGLVGREGSGGGGFPLMPRVGGDEWGTRDVLWVGHPPW